MSSPLNPKYQNEHLDAKIVAGLERIYEAFRVLLSEEARQQNLSPIQIQLLIFIQNHLSQQNTLSYLTKEFSLTKATLSQSVKTLKEKGLLTKETNPSDSRSQYLRLTNAGEAVVEKSQYFTQLLEQPVQQLDTNSQQKFWEGLKDILMSLQHGGAINLQRMCFSCNWYQAIPGGHYCKLLKIELEEQDIRIDCPEHSSVA